VIGIFGGGSSAAPAPMAPPPLPVVEPPPPAPTLVDPEVQRARETQKKRAAAMSGYASTIATSGLGVEGPASTTATSGGKALLGQ
jgi:hypothetical protein